MPDGDDSFAGMVEALARAGLSARARADSVWVTSRTHRQLAVNLARTADGWVWTQYRKAGRGYTPERGFGGAETTAEVVRQLREMLS